MTLTEIMSKRLAPYDPELVGSFKTAAEQKLVPQQSEDDNPVVLQKSDDKPVQRPMQAALF